MISKLRQRVNGVRSGGHGSGSRSSRGASHRGGGGAGGGGSDQADATVEEPKTPPPVIASKNDIYDGELISM